MSIKFYVFFRFGQFLAATLPVCAGADDKTDDGRLDDATPPSVLANRNEGLHLMCRLLSVNDKALNTT